jgi:hypothetical protein
MRHGEAGVTEKYAIDLISIKAAQMCGAYFRACQPA